jgi:hypothetical protein
MTKQIQSQRVVVRNVAVNPDTVQVVRFKFNAPRGTFIARTRRLPSIRIRPNPESNGWVATAKGCKGQLDARNPHKAFVAAAKAFWN